MLNNNRRKKKRKRYQQKNESVPQEYCKEGTRKNKETKTIFKIKENQKHHLIRKL